jgi:hypothetical protein
MFIPLKSGEVKVLLYPKLTDFKKGYALTNVLCFVRFSLY